MLDDFRYPVFIPNRHGVVEIVVLILQRRKRRTFHKLRAEGHFLDLIKASVRTPQLTYLMGEDCVQDRDKTRVSVLTTSVQYCPS